MNQMLPPSSGTRRAEGHAAVTEHLDDYSFPLDMVPDAEGDEQDTAHPNVDQRFASLATRNLRSPDLPGSPGGAAVSQAVPQVAGYEILEELGRGGMGVVYKAWQYSLQRTVALKMILAGGFASEQDVERFRSEAMAVARLSHPNLLNIYEIGQQDGRPFYAMEYLDGDTLAHRLDGRPQPAKTAAQLVLTLAQAMDYAHKQGIVHRDLKPANVLLAGGQDVPLDQAIAKITDFGLAKQLNQDGYLTKTGDILGTPCYMAPEQAAGRIHEVGPVTDVYSLGALLYELLTGRLLFQAANGMETLLLVANADPVPPRKWVRGLPRDIETICLKCLEKRPEKRYASAGHLADDLRRFLRGEPIKARKTPLVKRVVKWARRRPALAVLGVASVLVVVLSFGLLAAFWQKAEVEAHAEKSASAAKARALIDVQRLLAGSLLDRGIQLAERGDVRRGMHVMVKGLEVATELERLEGKPNNLIQAARLNLAGWSHAVFPQPVPLAHNGWAWAIAYSRDGRFVLTGGRDKFARVWDAGSGKPVGEPLAHPHPVWSVAFHPDGKTILTGCGQADGKPGQVTVWAQEPNQPGHFRQRGQLPSDFMITRARFSPMGDLVLAVAANAQAQLFKFSSVGAGSGCEPIGAPLRHGHAIRDAVFTPDGATVITASFDRTVRRWEAATAQPAGEPLVHAGPVECLAVSADGQLLLTGSGIGALAPNGHFPISSPGEARLWDLRTGKELGEAVAHPGMVKAVVFAADGRTVATSCAAWHAQEKRLDGDARLWDLDPQRRLVPRGQPLDHKFPVWALAFSPDSRVLLTGCEDGRARLWSAVTGQPISPSLGHEGNVVAVAFSPSGTTALTASAGGSSFACARLWEVPVQQSTGFPLVHDKQVTGVAWETNGRFVWTACHDGSLRQWHVADGTVAREIKSDKALKSLHLTADNRQAFAVNGPAVYQWDLATGQLRHEHFGLHNDHPPRFCPHPDGHSFLIGSEVANTFELRSVEDGKPLTKRVHTQHRLLGLTVSPDGTRAVTSANQWPQDLAHIELRDLRTGKEQRLWKHQGTIYALAFSPDSKLLATGGDDRQIQFWEIDTGKLHGAPLLHDRTVQQIVFSADGRLAATICDDGAARLWDMATRRQIGNSLKHGDWVSSLAFAPDSKILLTGSAAGPAVFWKVPSPAPGPVPRLRLWVEALTGMAMGETDVILPLDLDNLHERRQKLSAAPRD